MAAFFILFFSVITNKTISNTVKQKITSSYYEKKTNLKNDVRLPLWKSSIRLIIDHPVIGVGINNFESDFAPYKSLDYSTHQKNAVQTLHPHNTLLYVASTLGIPCLIFWCILWLYPLIYCLFFFSKLSLFNKIATLSYFNLFFCGLFDLTLFHWPTFYIAAILLGLLWQETFKKTNIKILEINFNAQSFPKQIKCPAYILAILILIYTFFDIYNVYHSSLYFSYGNSAEKIDKKKIALFYFKKGLEYKEEPKYLCKCGMILTSLNKPEKALKYLKLLERLSPNFAHSNSYMAINLIKINKLKEALPYLEKEVICYPLSVVAWYKLGMLQQKLKMIEEAKQSFKYAQTALKIKNLPPNAIKLLFDNPEYDFHPERIPKKQLSILNKQLTIEKKKRVKNTNHLSIKQIQAE